MLLLSSALAPLLLIFVTGGIADASFISHEKLCNGYQHGVFMGYNKLRAERYASRKLNRSPITRSSSKNSTIFFRGFSSHEREHYLKKYGCHQLSVLMMESPPFEYFDYPDKGFIAYQKRKGKDGFFGGGNQYDVFALGDPVSNVEDSPVLIDSFLERFPGATFVQVSPGNTVNYLTKRHEYWVIPFGVTSIVDLATWNLRGKQKQSIRTAINTAKRQGITIQEEISTTNSVATKKKNEITSQWLQTRIAKDEIGGFLLRNHDTNYQKGVRTFFACNESGIPIGFCQYDPMYSDHKVVGYLASVCIGHPDFVQGLSYAINAQAIEVFQSEENNVQFLDLGLCPLYSPEEDLNKDGSNIVSYKSIPLFQAFLEFIYVNCSKTVYNCQGLRFAKERYCGKDVMQYICTPYAIPSAGTIFNFIDLIVGGGNKDS